MENEGKTRRRYQFTLRDLLLVAVLLALALALGRQYSETARVKRVLHAYGLGLEADDLTASQFRVYVNKLVSGNDLVVQQVVIETVGSAGVTCQWKQGSVFASVDGGPGAGPLIRSSLLFEGKWTETKEPMDLLHTWVTVSSSNDGGGPQITSGYHVPKGKRLEDLLEMELVPGVYERGTVLPLCTLSGEKCTLTVK